MQFLTGMTVYTLFVGAKGTSYPEDLKILCSVTVMLVIYN